MCIYAAPVEISPVDQIETIEEMFNDILNEEFWAGKKKPGFFWFVEMESSLDANNAISALYDSELNGRNIVVNKVKLSNKINILL
jgi:heme oxygenase